MKIENAKGRRDENSGYIRLFDNVKLGQLLSKAQATVISNGTEFERIILSRTNNISDLDEFIDSVTDGTQPDGVYVCKKATAKKSKLTVPNHEPDLLVFLVQKKRLCKIIELKDGDTFDTKKARGEREQLEEYSIKFGAKIPFVAEYYICCFNQEDKDFIETGFKGVFTREHIMTGRELCEILSIDYDDIVESRKADARDNVDYFVSELLNIPEIKAEILRKLKK
ncbi:MAG: hypothetical protein NC253_09775 [Ruminococcus sp.]|nr:hypothetical protein [Ruminococcus sp.]MCM1478441.1 hypothetical protein [Muribaculaceae bacterium]